MWWKCSANLWTCLEQMKADLRKEELNGWGQFRLLRCHTAYLLYYSGAKIPQFTQLNVTLKINNMQDSKLN